MPALAKIQANFLFALCAVLHHQKARPAFILDGIHAHLARLQRSQAKHRRHTGALRYPAEQGGKPGGIYLRALAQVCPTIEHLPQAHLF